MNLDLTQQKSRRALIGAAGAAAVAAVAASIGRFNPVAAADGDDAKIGEQNDGSKTTTFNASGGAAGVTGISESGAGVHGESMSGAGLKAASNAGHGLNASSMQSYAIATEEGGLLFKGISGITTIPSGEKQADVDAQWVSSESFLLLSPHANIESRALWWEKNDDKFTIHIDSERSNDTQVAWLVIDHG